MSGSLQLNPFRYKVPAVFLEQIVFALDEWGTGTIAIGTTYHRTK
jgi:hypothetical protein